MARLGTEWRVAVTLEGSMPIFKPSRIRRPIHAKKIVWPRQDFLGSIVSRWVSDATRRRKPMNGIMSMKQRPAAQLNVVGRVGVEPTARWLRVATDQWFELLNVVKVSPFIVENHGFADVLLIPWLLLNSVRCEELTHKISTAKWGEPLCWDSLELAYRQQLREGR